MATTARKVYAGVRLKRLRRERQLTQAAMAAELDVSPSYLNLMERNQRPITVQVLIRLADVYGVDPRDFMAADGDHSGGEMEQIFSDPLFGDLAIPRAELRDAAENSPALAAAVARLYRAYAAAREASEAGGAATGPARAGLNLADSPFERLQNFLHESRNHFPEIEEAAENFAAELALTGGDLFSGLCEHLRARHNIRVRVLPAEVMAGRLRWFDHHRRQLMIAETVGHSGRTFGAAYQLALAQFGELVTGIAERIEPNHDVTRRLLRIALANYFAAALMMPYGRFYEAAELSGYDIELLSARFGASFEQVAHRLTTLARQSARGVPFFFIRVDMAGNVSKRFSNGFPFAHSGGTCPLWNIHASFAAPGKILTQLVELPDGSQWFSITRTVRRSRTPFGGIEPRFAVAVGCEIKYAKRLVYAKHLDAATLDVTPIGINCRLCDRPACAQRSAPPAMRQPVFDESMRSTSPFTFKEV